MKLDSGILGLLFDREGTLLNGDRVINGAIETVAYARKHGYELRFLTNITKNTPSQIAHNLRSMGFNVSDYEIFTATSSCASYLRGSGYKRIRLVLPEQVLELFEGLPVVECDPDVIVIGDVTEKFTYDFLNTIFAQLNHGASLMSMSRNMFDYKEGEKHLDIGAYISLLEAAADKEAFITGKPSEIIFNAAISSMNLNKEQILIVGDDILTDITGARNLKLRSCLVGTGKFKSQDRHFISKDSFFINSIADLPNYLRT